MSSAFCSNADAESLAVDQNLDDGQGNADWNDEEFYLSVPVYDTGFVLLTDYKEDIGCWHRCLHNVLNPVSWNLPELGIEKKKD